MMLAAACPAQPGQTVLELGCGVGVASLCLAARVGRLDLIGVERDPGYAALARANAARNGLPFRVVEADLTLLPPDLRASSVDHVIMNPPFFRVAPRRPTPPAPARATRIRRSPSGWMRG